MLGQTFAPLFDPSQKQQQLGSQSQAGAQQAIQTLNTRLPRFSGGYTPAPLPLLTSPGSAGLPTEHISPIIQAILQSVLGHFSPQQIQPRQSPPPGGTLPPNEKNAPAEPLPLPRTVYQDLGVGGTAGKTPMEMPDTREDRENRRGKMGTDTFMNNY